MRELKRQMAEIDARIENMFDEPGLRQVGPPGRRGGHRAGVMGPLGRPSLPSKTGKCEWLGREAAGDSSTLVYS